MLMNSKSLTIYVQKIKANKHSTGRPKCGIIISIHQRIDSNFTGKDRSGQILAVELVNLKFIAAYFQPKIKKEHIKEKVSGSLNKLDLRIHTTVEVDLNARLEIRSKKDDPLISFFHTPNFSRLKDCKYHTIVSKKNLAQLICSSLYCTSKFKLGS